MFLAEIAEECSFLTEITEYTEERAYRRKRVIMNIEFFKRKVRELSDEKLIELLTLRHKTKPEIIDLAIKEADNRGLAIPYVPIPDNEETINETDKQKLTKWNWAAFLMAPFWTLANKLDKWFLLTVIPGVNVVAIIYLGLKGNRLAYEKSTIRNISEFMLFQAHWNKWAIRIMSISIGISLTFMIISKIGN